MSWLWPQDWVLLQDKQYKNNRYPSKQVVLNVHAPGAVDLQTRQFVIMISGHFCKNRLIAWNYYGFLNPVPLVFPGFTMSGGFGVSTIRRVTQHSEFRHFGVSLLGFFGFEGLYAIYHRRKEL
ncbi:hypothetical protein VTN77DRAFT_4675 [Rasamsonia byssochlamydoides]|uniref:uncharacterized protein n=1 Tax=Rasamsonia byssochlamydoides TaxID=89139 RepID=UPI003742B22E